MDALFIVRVRATVPDDGGHLFVVEHVGTRVRCTLATASEIVAFIERAIAPVPEPDRGIRQETSR